MPKFSHSQTIASTNTDTTIVGTNEKSSRTNSDQISLSQFASWNSSITQTADHFATDTSDGLNSEDASRRLGEYGENCLDEGKGVSIWQVFLHQVCNAMVVVLLICMAISFGIKDWIAGGVIGGVFFLNVAVGFIQEFSAEKTMAALRSLSSPTARVIRDGDDQTIPSLNVVPGDLVVAKVGDTIPADLRLVSSMNFETDEALLTGESLPVAKDHKTVVDFDSPVGDRINMAFSSSVVSKGRAVGIVVATGMSTEIGAIAKSLKESENKKVRSIKVDRKRDFLPTLLGAGKDVAGAFLGTTTGTPLHRLLAKLSIMLFGVAVLLAIIAMAAQKFRVNREVAVYAICVALSMIPASLVVVLTITMAMGTSAMVKRNVIVRKLDSLEALGAVNDICSDKTGTLTQGKMVVRKAWVPGVCRLAVDSDTNPFDPTAGIITGTFSDDEKPENVDDQVVASQERLRQFVMSATMANIATIHQEADTGDWKCHGDPTEIAVQVFTSRLQYPRDRFTAPENEKKVQSPKEYQHVAEFPFDSSVKRMSAIYKHSGSEDGAQIVFTKGAVERLVGICSTWYGDNTDPSSTELLPFSDKEHQRVFQMVEELASQGLRVLAFASKTLPKDFSLSSAGEGEQSQRLAVESNLTFLGLVGIYDPPRAESAGAVAKCHKAGITVHMLTGDHPGTAKAIAQEVGILPTNFGEYATDVVKSMVYTATEFDALTDSEIDSLPQLPLVIARCAPQTKVRMIEALHRRKAFTAMTGDGVNDSPSLKQADVGIAMGISGSDVAKDASDIVLSDDNFASITNAIEEGRRMADNIQKFVLHLLAGNVSQVLFLMIALAFKDHDNYSVFPLSPVEVLWIIMVTSSFPAMGLGVEQAELGIMEKPPKDPRKAIFTPEVLCDMLLYGLWLAIICLVTFIGIVYGDGNGNLGQGCNESYSEACRYVYRARSTAFAEMTWGLLLLAWEVVDMRRSPFQFPRRIWQNQFLFWSVVLGFVSVFPIIYIPVINKDVFKHSPITWEWGVAFLGLIVFIMGSELYKFAKRRFFRGKMTVSSV